jgi:flagellar motor switch protein FliN/FliY
MTSDEPIETSRVDDEWAAALAEQGATQGARATVDVTAVESAGDTSQLFPRLSGVASEARNDIDMILDIPVQLTVEPMDVLVNGCLIAQGEVVVVNDKFGIRLTDIVTPNERVRRLNRA